MGNKNKRVIGGACRLRSYTHQSRLLSHCALGQWQLSTQMSGLWPLTTCSSRSIGSLSHLSQLRQDPGGLSPPGDVPVRAAFARNLSLQERRAWKLLTRESGLIGASGDCSEMQILTAYPHESAGGGTAQSYPMPSRLTRLQPST